MPVGMIKHYNADKGFGFIAQPDGEDIFFHISTCGMENLTVGQPVSFEIEQGKKGQEARQLAINENPPSDLVEKLKSRFQRKRKPAGDKYTEKQIKDKTPMVFETYSETMECIIAKDLKFDLCLLCGEETKQIEKLNIKYCYKKEYEQAVKAAIQYDEGIKTQCLQVIEPMRERYKIRGQRLKRAKAEQLKIRLVLRGGETLEGTIDWFSPYEIKVEFPLGGNVIAFRHAVYDFAILGQSEQGEQAKPLSSEQTADEQPQDKKPQDEQQEQLKEAKPQVDQPKVEQPKVETENVVKVSITKEQAAVGARVTIPVGDGKKAAIKLPAGVSDGKRFKIKARYLVVVITVKG